MLSCLKITRLQNPTKTNFWQSETSFLDAKAFMQVSWYNMHNKDLKHFRLMVIPYGNADKNILTFPMVLCTENFVEQYMSEKAIVQKCWYWPFRKKNWYKKVLHKKILETTKCRKNSCPCSWPLVNDIAEKLKLKWSVWTHGGKKLLW